MMGSFLPEPDDMLRRMPWHWVWAYPMIFIPFAIWEFMSDNFDGLPLWVAFPILLPCWILMVVGYLALGVLYAIHDKTHTLLKK